MKSEIKRREKYKVEKAESFFENIHLNWERRKKLTIGGGNHGKLNPSGTI
jgi:hypothetical protein